MVVDKRSHVKSFINCYGTYIERLVTKDYRNRPVSDEQARC